MSISSTLSNAISGLTAASRSAQVVSTNVSNAMTDGYSRREIELSARDVGGIGAGVRVDGVRRVVDETLLRDRRLASASVEESHTLNAFQRTALDLMGEPQDASSLVQRVAELDRSLLAATSRPESEGRLLDVLNAAKSLTEKLNSVSDGLDSARQDADRNISRDVARLNESLQQVADLNAQILRARATNRDYPSLLDNRQKLIDDISGLIPIREMTRENDTVALYTTHGALLVDVTPAQFGFVETGLITADMTVASGALSGLTLNGAALRTTGQSAPIAGGRLAALFTVRDEHAPAVQREVDSLASDLIARFEDPAMDPTLAPGAPGLFTDNGSPLDLTDLVGIAGRIKVNPSVDPTVGGGVWRLRDGLGASAVGPVGNTILLDAMQQRLTEPRPSGSGTLSPANRSVQAFAADFVSVAGQSLNQANSRTAFQQARFTTLDDAIMANGVDTDQELQKLLLIEQSYAANARVIQTADDLIQLLIGL